MKKSISFIITLTVIISAFSAVTAFAATTLIDSNNTITVFEDNFDSYTTADCTATTIGSVWSTENSSFWVGLGVDNGAVNISPLAPSSVFSSKLSWSNGVASLNAPGYKDIHMILDLSNAGFKFVEGKIYKIYFDVKYILNGSVLDYNATGNGGNSAAGVYFTGFTGNDLKGENKVAKIQSGRADWTTVNGEWMNVKTYNITAAAEQINAGKLYVSFDALADNAGSGVEVYAAGMAEKNSENQTQFVANWNNNPPKIIVDNFRIETTSSARYNAKVYKNGNGNVSFRQGGKTLTIGNNNNMSVYDAADLVIMVDEGATVKCGDETLTPGADGKYVINQEDIPSMGDLVISYPHMTASEPVYEESYTFNNATTGSIITYGKFTGAPIDAKFGMLMQKGENEYELEAKGNLTDDGRFAIRVVGNAINSGTYKFTPYYKIWDNEPKTFDSVSKVVE